MWATILGYLILCGSYVWLLKVVFSLLLRSKQAKRKPAADPRDQHTYGIRE